MATHSEAILSSWLYLWSSVSSVDIVIFGISSIFKIRSFIKEFISLISPANVIAPITAFIVSIVLLQCFKYFLSLRSGSDSTDGFTMKPMLFPCQTYHIRYFPEKHSFRYSYLLAGIPVGWKGSIGGILSADVEQDSSPWYLRLFSLKLGGAWYTVHGDDYLERGHVEGGLRGKLDSYLISQGENPSDYPHVYLLTAARFLGYSSNPLSIWNLYNATKDLTGVILEVNNTFDERHMYFLKASSLDLQESSKDKLTASWAKQFYVSPLNARDGSYSILTQDPFRPSQSTSTSQPTPWINTTITLSIPIPPTATTATTSSPPSKPKLTARLTSYLPALHPATMSLDRKTLFLLRNGWIGLATFPRTVKEAFNLLVRRGLSWVTRPPPLAATIARHASSWEALIAGEFQRWLEDVVAGSMAGKGSGKGERIGGVRYIPAGVASSDAVVFPPDAVAGNVVEVRILSPSFYASFARHASSVDAFESEMANATISISDLPALRSLLTDSPNLKSKPNNNTSPKMLISKLSSWEKIQWKAISLVRSPPSLFERYMISKSSADTRKAYTTQLIKVLTSEYIAFGAVEVLEMELFLGRCAGVWMVVGWLWG